LGQLNLIACLGIDLLQIGRGIHELLNAVVNARNTEESDRHGDPLE
jgi:hypothetical protein